MEKEKEKSASEASSVVDTRRFFFPPRSQPGPNLISFGIGWFL